MWRIFLYSIIVLTACSKPNVSNLTVDQIKYKPRMSRDEFLGHMATLESGNGLNTNHSLMTSGIHSGQYAVGRYGLMPKTITDMIKRLKAEKNVPKALRTLLNKGLTEQALANEIAKDELLERFIVDRLYDHVYNRFNGNVDYMNWSWLYGHNSNMKRFRDNNDRVIKFRRLLEERSTHR